MSQGDCARDQTAAQAHRDRAKDYEPHDTRKDGLGNCSDVADKLAIDCSPDDEADAPTDHYTGSGGDRTLP